MLPYSHNYQMDGFEYLLLFYLYVGYHIYTNLELLPDPVPPQDPLPIPFHAPQDQEAAVRGFFPQIPLGERQG